MEFMRLNNGNTAPLLGIGTYMIRPADAEKAVREAIKMGYRMVDTANVYVNEKAVGQGIQTSGVKREEIFISSKLWVSEYQNDKAIDETLERLGIEYIDLLYLHQPVGDYMNAYRMLEAAYRDGRVKAIGLSNFYGDDLQKVLSEATIKPQVVQYERHPYYTGKDVEKVLEEQGIKVMSWYPLGHGNRALLSEPLFQELGRKYGKTPAQIILRWHVEMGFMAIPGSKNQAHIRENLAIFDFKLSEEDMERIAELNKERKYVRFNGLTKLFLKIIRPRYEQ